MTVTEKLYLKPQPGGYSTGGAQNEVIRADGPAGRYQTGIGGAATIIPVSFQLDAPGWQYFWAFLRNRVGRGAEPFLVDLPLDGSGIVEHTAWLIPGSHKLTGTRGPLRYMSAELELLPLSVDAEEDTDVIEAWEAIHA